MNIDKLSYNNIRDIYIKLPANIQISKRTLYCNRCKGTGNDPIYDDGCYDCAKTGRVTLISCVKQMARIEDKDSGPNSYTGKGIRKRKRNLRKEFYLILTAIIIDGNTQ